MARTNNLTDFLNDVATAIKTKLDDSTSIPASQFDTKIMEIETGGSYQDKTVNVTQNGTQTITPDTNYDALSSIILNVNVPVNVLQSKTYEFTDNAHIVLSPEQGYDGFSSIDLTINVPSGSINNQDKTITQNGVYTADSGYTGLGEVTVNVQNSNIKIYDTYNDMISDNTAVENNIGLVYSSNFEPLQLNQKISAISYEDNFTLDEAITFSSSKTIKIKNDDVTVNLSVSISASIIRCDMTINLNNISYSWRPKWTSSDGINYTISTSATNPIPLRDLYIVSSLPSEPYLSIINKFLKVKNLTFGGLYKYYNTADTDYYNMITGMSYNETYSSTNNIVYLPKLKNDIEYILYECNDIKTSNIGIYKYNNNNYIVRDYIYAMYDTTNNNAYLVVYASKETVNDVVRYYYYVANMDTSTEFTKIICDDNDRIGTTSYFKIGLLSQYNYIVDGSVSNVSDDMTFNISKGNTPVFAYTNGTNFNRININNNPGLKYGYVEFLGWHNIIGSTSARFDYQVYNTLAFGKNRLINGNTNILNHISNTDFSNKWLDGHTDIISVYSTVQPGDNVKTQTLVSREFIPIDVDNSIPTSNSIVSIYDGQTSEYVDFTDNIIMQQFYTREYTLYNTSTTHNGVHYQIIMKSDIVGTNVTNLTQIVNPVFIVFNTLTGEIVNAKSLSETFYICPSQKEGRIRDLSYDFNNNCWRFISGTRNTWTMDNKNPYILCSVFEVSNTLVRHDISYKLYDNTGSTIQYGRINYANYDNLNNVWYTTCTVYDNGTSSNIYYSVIRIDTSGNINTLHVFNSNVNTESSVFSSYGQLIRVAIDSTDNRFTDRLIDGTTGQIILDNIYAENLNVNVLGLYEDDKIIINNYVDNSVYAYDTTNKVLVKKLDNASVDTSRTFIINNELYYINRDIIYNSDFTETNRWYNFNNNANILSYYTITNNVINIKVSYALSDTATSLDHLTCYRKCYNNIKYYRFFTVDTLPISTELFITMNTKQYKAKQLTYIPDVNNDQNQEEEVEE